MPLGASHMLSLHALPSMSTSEYLDFLHGDSGFKVRVAKTRSELQDCFLIYSRKSQNVSSITFYWLDRASSDSMWGKTVHIGVSTGTCGSLGSHLGCWLHDFLASGMTLLNRD